MGADKMDLIEEGGSHHNVPKVPPTAVSGMTKKEWLREYGSTLSSERHFLERDPNWVQDKKSWWYRVTGRGGEEPPLWMQEEWHIPELDFPAQGDRRATTIDVAQDSEKPLWAERMNLRGEVQGPQSATIFGHRQEYLPANKSRARSMYDRYQPSYQRLVNDEIPDTAAPPDGRFWKAGISQGVTTNPYEKSISLSGHRKPIVVGPRSISVVVDGEGHSLANVVRDVAWTRPEVEFAGYSLEHPVYRHMNLRLQVKPDSEKKSEQVLSDTLHATKGVMASLGDAMSQAMGTWEMKT